MLYPSLWSGYYADLPLEECVARLKEAGFAHSELSTGHTQQLLSRYDPEKAGLYLRHFLQEEGFCIPQAHLSFSPALAAAEGWEQKKQELALYMAAGIRNAVVHFNGANDLEPEARQEARLAGLRQLQDFVKGSEVYLCLENLGSVPETHTVQKLLGIMEACGGGNLGICLDTGHLHLVNGRGEASQSQREFILAAGKHLRALHITENNGKNDVHQMPYSARYGIDWPQVVQALRDIGYEGILNFEALGEATAPEPIKSEKARFMGKLGPMLAAL